MKCAKRFLWFLLLAVWIAALPAAGLADNSGQTVYIISLKDEITPAMSAYLADQIEMANLSGAQGIIIDISTLGGLVSSALEIRDNIVDSGIPVAVYVRNRAESAGALITIAAETIVMAPGSHMGAAEPIPYSEKAAAFVSGEFRTTANLRGRNPLIAAGMVDKNLDVPGFPKGQLVDLTAEEAKKVGYADAVLAAMPETLEYLGWEGAQIVQVEPDTRTRIAQFLTRNEVASILLTVAMIAMVIEIFVQGFGLPGIISIIAFTLYFGGGFLAGNTEWWSVLLFFTGVLLIFIEMAVPGFGVFGISGIIALLTGIVFAAPDPLQGLTSLGIAIAATAVLIPILYKLLGGPRLFRRFVLQETESTEKGYVSKRSEDHEYLVGMIGETVTPLRPSGTILIDGKRVDALSEGSYLPTGSRIQVIQVEGAKIIVSPAGE
jgi:membrane-bound serine protease (ClpP class)